MAEVKWIKITTDIFKDDKISIIHSMPGGGEVILIWFQLLCMAGRLNNSGIIKLDDNTAYTDEMLAVVFHCSVDTLRRAFKVLSDFRLIIIDDGVITIRNWEKHQNIDKLDRLKDMNRERVAKHRKSKREALQDSECNVTAALPVMQCNGIEEEGEVENKNKKEDIDGDKEGEVEAEKSRSLDGFSPPSSLPRQVVNLFNEVCVSLAPVKQLTDKRRESIERTLRTYSLDDYRRCFELAEASTFLKGSNGRGWTANFDWLISEDNITKVLEGNYTDRPREQSDSDRGSSSGHESSSFDTDEFFEAALRRSYEQYPPSPRSDEDLDTIMSPPEYI